MPGRCAPAHAPSQPGESMGYAQLKRMEAAAGGASAGRPYVLCWTLFQAGDGRILAPGSVAANPRAAAGQARDQVAFRSRG